VVIPAGQSGASSGGGGDRLTGSGGRGTRRRLALDRLTINRTHKLRTVRTRGLRVVTRLQQPETQALRVRVWRLKRRRRRSLLLQEFRRPGDRRLYRMRLRNRTFRRAFTPGRYELQVRPRGVTTTGRTARYVFRVKR
jgi:hypothetical protein